MANRYFDTEGLTVVDGSLAKATHVNSVTEETNTAFELVQSEIDSIGSSVAISYAWANYDQGSEIDPTNNPDEYSSRAYAQEAQSWTSGTANVDTRADGIATIPYSAAEKALEASDAADLAVARAQAALDAEQSAENWAIKTDGVVEPGEYSSKYHASNAANSAGQALGSAAAALISEGIATTKAGEASDSADDALDAKNLAVTAQGLSEDARDASITAQGLSEGARDASITAQGLSEDARDASITAQGLAQAAQTNTEAVYDSFDDRYLGAKASDPTLDNDGNTLITGALYFNTTFGEMRVYSGSSWDASYLPAGAYLTTAHAVASSPHSSSTDIGFKLGDASGSYSFSIRTDADDSVFDVYSDGQVTITNTVSIDASLDFSFGTGNIYLDTGTPIQARSGQNVTVKLGDAVGANKMSITDSGGAEQCSLDSDGNLSLLGTGAAKLPVGTTAQRPGTPATGQIRYNSTDGTFEGYNGSEWGAIGGGGGLEWQAEQSVDFTAEDGMGYPMSGGITMTLPASPTDNMQIGWKDFENEFDTVPCYINPNGNPIEGLGTGFLTLNTRGQGGMVVWMTDRWMITEITDMGTSEPVNTYELVDCTGLSTLTLDVGIVDTYELDNLTVACAVSFSNFTNGRTVVVIMNAAGTNGVTFSGTIFWPAGSVPTYGANLDMVVFTKIPTGLAATYSLNLS